VSAPLLELSGIVSAYGPVEALHAVDLTVPEGAIVAVVGANGAGKSTLLRSISGLLAPAAGSIRFEGADLVKVPVEERIRLGLVHVPEGRHVIGALTVEENLRLGALWRRNPTERARDIAETYELFPALGRRSRQPGSSLSGGERQMLAIGRALVSHPRLLLLDEPSLGLAPRVVAEIMVLLRQLRTSRGLSILLVEQNVRTALDVADTGVVLNLGRVVTARPASELLADTALRHLYLGF
jgi:branched-chain amino acid transport system ATP-binding protein